VDGPEGPIRTAVELIGSIPDIKKLGAHVIVSEIGIDMSRFPSAAHLISWACICPRNDESASCARLSQPCLPGSCPDVSATFTTVAFDNSSLRWLEAST
jgi:hypothetical protein